MERKQVVLVDVLNNPIGVMDKLSAHKKPCLHRAFSVFLINDNNEILIQKRAEHKYHSGGKWANACCSHPENKTENILLSATKRLNEELGILDVELKQVFDFVYFAQFNESLFEYEYDCVLLGKYNGDIHLNKEEASEYKWVSKSWLVEDMTKNPSKYAVWFLSCASKILSLI